jgi:hypothetical protein
MNEEATTVEENEEIEVWSPGSVFGERYARLVGQEIADEVMEASPDDGFDDQTEEGRNWLTDFYGELRRLNFSDPSNLVDFLHEYYGDRLKDLTRDELTACAEAFGERIETQSI